jgi:uncharacterized lipoprotein YddW (UPF0748 family)
MLQRLCASFISCVVFSTAAFAQPVQVETVTRALSGGTARGFFATVDLTDRRVELVVTAPQPPGSASDSVSTRVDTWRTNNRLALAINANFFGTVSGSNTDIVGLAINDGAITSPARQYLVNPYDPAFILDRNRTARIGNFGPADLTNAWAAVAGVGPSNTDSDPGTLLVTNGVNTGATARVDPANRNPRTAIGINQAGTLMYLCVIDGRQVGWSDGMTNAELATFMIEKGVWRAVNLDGGGSSSFVYLQNNGTVAANRPSDGVFRAVASQLGVRIRDGSQWFPGLTRPVRGAWLRPVSITGFQTTCASLSAAGIQDIFLETLFWGRDAANVGDPNFPSHFGFDFVGQALPIAQRYGVRVHAWLETGYLDYGTTPSPLMQANPGWVVDHRNPSNTSTGDQADQRFVNLGNPAVQAVLSNYINDLTEKYPALEGVQADYNFFPLAGTSAAPWSFDSWARTAYQAQYGSDPINLVNVAATSFPTNWLTFNRQNVTNSLVAFKQAVNTASTSPLYSATCFADWNGGTHTSKMIDLPRWTGANAADVYIPMSYFGSVGAIEGDLDTAKTNLPNRRIIAGLANLTTSARPSVAQQLTAIRGRNLEEFSWFDAPTMVASPTMRSDALNFVRTQVTQLKADVANAAGVYGSDGYIDTKDLDLFDSIFTGTPIARTAGNARLDFNGDYTIDGRDRFFLMNEFVRFKLGEDGVVNQRDLFVLTNAFNAGPAPASGIEQVYDLDGDGDVDAADQTLFFTFVTVPFAPNFDVNNDGRVDINDLYAQRVSPTDVNRDGVTNTNDTKALTNELRKDEMTSLLDQR